MTGLDVLFACFGLLTGAAALLAVTARSVLHAALWLVAALGGLAGCYLVLGAELVALIHLLVYVGAVVILVIFALMLTRHGGTPIDAGPTHRVMAGLVAGGVAGVLGATLISAYGTTRVATGGPSAAEIGAQIFGTWVWPFELLSLLLLAALVATLAVARPSRQEQE